MLFMLSSHVLFYGRDVCTCSRHGTLSCIGDTLQSFQKDLGSYQQSVDAANESGEHLVSKVLDNPAITKEDMAQLNHCWEDLCQQSVDKQDRLNEALRAAEEFEGGLSDLLGWIDSKARELTAQPDPEEDAHGLQQQIENNKVRHSWKSFPWKNISKLHSFPWWKIEPCLFVF